jgi:hypothetical protein
VIVVDASAFLSVVLGQPSGDAVLNALLCGSGGMAGRARLGSQSKGASGRGKPLGRSVCAKRMSMSKAAMAEGVNPSSPRSFSHSRF